MLFWVPACAGMTGRGLRAGDDFVCERGYLCWHALRGALWGERYLPGVAARWPYPALRRCNPFGIGTGGRTYITPTVIPTRPVIPAQVGTQWSARRDLTPSYPRRRVPSGAQSATRITILTRFPHVPSCPRRWVPSEVMKEPKAQY